MIEIKCKAAANQDGIPADKTTQASPASRHSTQGQMAVPIWLSNNRPIPRSRAS